MPIDLKKLREEFATHKTAAQAILEKADTEKRDFTPEETTAFDKASAEMDRLEKFEQRQTKLAAEKFTVGDVTLPTDPPGKDEANPVEIKVTERFTMKHLPEKVQHQFKEAMRVWAATGEMDPRFATVTTATANGAYLPVEVVQPIVATAPNVIREALAAYGLQAQYQPHTNDTMIPILNPNAGGLVSETATTETENEPTPGSIHLHPQTYQSGATYISELALNAVGYDMFAQFLPEMIYQKELGVENLVMTGMVADNNITQTVTAASISTISFQNLATLNRKLPKRYNTQKVIILSHDAITAAENLIASTGQPILIPDVQTGSFRRFNNTPVLYSDYLSGFGANNVIGLVVSLTGYRFLDCLGNQVKKFDQNVNRPGQVAMNLIGFHAWGYDVQAVAKLVCPAS